MKNTAKILTLSIVFVLALLPMAQADNIGGSVTVGSSDITISNISVDGDDIVDPAVNNNQNTLFTTVSFVVNNPNGWKQTEIAKWSAENKTTAKKVRYGNFPIVLGSEEYVRFEWDNAEIPIDERKTVDSTGDYDINVSCPTGDCRDEITIETTGSAYNTEIAPIDLSDRTGNWLDLSEINITEEAGTWGTSVTLTGGNCTEDPQYTTFDYCYTDGTLGASLDGRATLVGLKNNQSDYVLLAIETAEQTDRIEWKYMISDTPDLSATVSNGYEDFGKLTANGVEPRSEGNYYLNELNTRNDANATEINSTTAEVTAQIGTPLMWGATSEAEVNSEDLILRAYQHGDTPTDNYTEYTHQYNILEYKSFNRIVIGSDEIEFGEIKPTESSTVRTINLRRNNVPITLNVSATDFTGDDFQGNPHTVGIENVELNETENIQTSCFTPSIYTMSDTTQEVRTIYPVTENTCPDGSYGIPEEQFTLTLPSGLDIPTQTTLTNTFTWTLS